MLTIFKKKEIDTRNIIEFLGDDGSDISHEEKAEIEREVKFLSQIEKSGTAAEKSAAIRLLRPLRNKIDLIEKKNGRPIDLLGLLSQRRSNGDWRWTVASPFGEINRGNGCRLPDGRVMVITAGNRWSETLKVKTRWIDRTLTLVDEVVPSGFPILPDKVRQICKDNLSKVFWIGVLYQPDAWKPAPVVIDPAVVCVFKDGDPNDYRCLAVWGHDGPNIMEFVD